MRTRERADREILRRVRRAARRYRGLGRSPAAAVPTSPIRVAAEQAEASATRRRAQDGHRAVRRYQGLDGAEQDLDPEEARAIVDPALKLMIDAVHRYDGYVVQSTGDGIFALFGAPVAHEDHPQRALYAALRMQEELKRYSAKLARGGQPADRGARRRQHRRSGGALDHNRRRTHRIHADRAHDQSRVADADARADRLDRDQRADAQAVRGLFRAQALGPTRVKGVSEPVNVYEVTGLGPLRTRLQRSAGRGLTKFVGREREMEAIEARRRAGQGGTRANRRGDGGSRASASRGCSSSSRRASQSGWMVLEAFSVSHGKASAPICR